nr:MAG TPA: major capsid protein [Caudoviricetes sp.]
MIPDIDEALSHFDVRSEYSKQMGEALALKMDGAVLAEAAKMVVANKENLTGLGKGEIITKKLAAADIGVTEAEGKALVQALLEIKAKMSNNYVPETERYVFMTPEARTALIASLVAINRDYGGVATITDANILRIAGFDIIECPHLTMGGAEVNDGLLQGDGHVFPTTYKDKCAFIAMHKSAVGTVKLRDLKLERARRAEYQADMLAASYAVGHGGLRPEAAYMGCIEATV